MRDAISTRPEVGSPLGSPSLMPRLLTALLLCGALLPAVAAPASACGLNWADPAVVWTSGTQGPHTFPLTGGSCPAGATVTITLTPTPASGSFVLGTPAEDCADASQCPTNLFGLSHDLGLDFDPGANKGTSPITITAVFSSPLTSVVFEISDIDFGGPANSPSARLDQVVIDSNAGQPSLSFKTVGSHTFSISGNTATAICTGSFPNCSDAQADQTTDAGTVVVNFGVLSVTTVTITYNEVGNNTDPAGRGIGILANLTATPVELTGFTIE